ncbi:glycoside hydrolase family 26 protein [Cellulomonas telluris]|uniref:glycoside hydrolase family 26 protein n=1 Tax=Cellulomonas telluris TaxID=2306636 RepID=UPI001FE44A45|nr:glycosyl hydrolase [Cellulomonas telluris]
MSERTGKHWWTLTGRLGFAARLGALVTALALGAVTGIVWLSPSGALPGTPKTAAEKELEREVADLRAVLADRDDEIAAIQRGQEKAKSERAAAAERGKAKAAAEKAAAAERGKQKAATAKAAGQGKAAREKAAAAQRGKAKAAAERAAAAARGKEKAALERQLAEARGDAQGAAIRESVAAAQVAAARAAAAARAEAAKPVKPTAPALSSLMVPDHRYFGLYTPQSPFNWAEVDSVASQVGLAPNMAGYFQGWDTPFRADAVTRSWEKGMLPFLTWESRPMAADNNQVEDPEYSLPRIIDGAFDDYLREYARGVAATGLPMAIRLNHEMNGSWYPWSEQGSNAKPINGNRPGDFVKMWQHVHDIFESEGANAYVIWVWSPNIVNNLPATNRTLDYTRSLYPGDEYVDWVGMSGYYRPPYREGQTPTFDYTFGQTLTQLRAISSKPVVLAEIGASESGGDKPRWTTDLFDALARPENSDVIGLAWFHHSVTTISGGERITNDWRITSRSDSLAAFVEGIHDPAAGFLPGAAPLAAASPLAAPAEPFAAEQPAAPAPEAAPEPAPVLGPPTPTPTPQPANAPAPTSTPAPTTGPARQSSTPTPSPTPSR